MNRLFNINLLPQILIYLTLFASEIKAFEEAIFEDEDIYRRALPAPPPSTGMTAPGTKWCGPGNTSMSYDDLGEQRETDMCCREHDYCDDVLEGKSTLHGLHNSDMFSILKCSCEQKFINCLQAVNNMFSNTIGHIYYGARSVCINKGYPIINCKQYQEGSIRKRCILYNVDKTKPKKWQFYEMPFFTQSTENSKH